MIVKVVTITMCDICGKELRKSYPIINKTLIGQNMFLKKYDERYNQKLKDCDICLDCAIVLTNTIEDLKKVN